MLLGAISIALMGCSHKQALVKYGPPPTIEKYGPPEEMVAMYGVRPDRINAPEDTIDAPMEAPAEPIMCKYGVPPVRPKQL